MKFPYGQSNFQGIREDGYLYIDKTRYIEKLEACLEKYLVLLRSRRFGKTLFVNMLGYYYDQLHADKFDPLFHDLYIHAHPTPHRNQYMMLTFNFSGINTETLENANEGFAAEVYGCVDVFLGRYQHYFTPQDQEEILAQKKPNNILNALFHKLEKKGIVKSVYVLIDEYDHFANNILAQGKEMFKDLVRTDGYVRPFYEALKKGTETVVDRIFITGVMPILLDSLTSGFNIGKNKSTDARFNEVVGFTEAEIMPIIEYLGSEDIRLDELRTYYNGYCFSPEATTRVYNSDMILYYACEYDRHTRTIRSMIDTNVVSDYRKIRAILSIGDQALEEEILTRIIADGSMTVNGIAELFILTRETEFLFDAKTLISLLFYMGYLTITGKDRLGLTLSMPNLVLKSLYLEYMQYVLMKRGQTRIDGLKKDEMLRDLVAGKIDLLIELTERLLHGLSNRDYEKFDEKYIKLIMLSLLSDVDIYIAHSEYEVDAGGYVDLYLQAAFEPEISAHYFLELKYAKAKATKAVLDAREREGRQAMQTYLTSRIADSIPHLHAYVLVFRKDRCVRTITLNREPAQVKSV